MVTQVAHSLDTGVGADKNEVEDKHVSLEGVRSEDLTGNDQAFNAFNAF